MKVSHFERKGSSENNSISNGKQINLRKNGKQNNFDLVEAPFQRSKPIEKGFSSNFDRKELAEPLQQHRILEINTNLLIKCPSQDYTKNLQFINQGNFPSTVIPSVKEENIHFRSCYFLGVPSNVQRTHIFQELAKRRIDFPEKFEIIIKSNNHLNQKIHPKK
jgi:hypothetical protein